MDRYLLKELSAAESEEFERHYFECEECAAAVEAGQLFIVNAQEVLREMPRAVVRPALWERLGIRWTWGGMLLPATSLALSMVAVYQGTVVIPKLNAPRVLPAFQLIGASRGEATVVEVPTGAAAFALAVDVPPDAHFARYNCELQVGGTALFTLPAEAPAPGQPITILVPTKRLSGGDYQLVLRGPEGDRNISIFSFTLRFR